MQYHYLVRTRCFEKIYSFYYNVSLKYRHSYSEELMHKNIDDTVDSIYKIEKDLQRRNPILKRWKNFFMANTEKWYFAYTIEDDTVVVEDACHVQNMHEEV